MKIYNFHPETGEYLGESEADKSPLEKDVWLVPANATEKKPPTAGENEIPVFSEEGWSLTHDFRGVKYWNDSGEEFTVFRIGEPIPDGYLSSPPRRISEKKKRDSALAALVHDFGDGRVIQCRPHPFSDGSNMRNAIEQMGRRGETEREWFAADNTRVKVSAEDLQTAIESGQDQSDQVWAEFFKNIEEGR